MQNESFMPSVSKYGLFGGFAIIIVGLILLITSNPSNIKGLFLMFIVSILASIIVYAIFSTLSIKMQRDQIQGGYITYGHALATGFLTCLIIAILGTIFSYIYHNFIDATYFATMASSMGEFLEEQGLPDEKIEEQVEKIKQSASIGTMAMSVVYGSIFGLVISLITAAILKKEPDHNTLD